MTQPPIPPGLPPDPNGLTRTVEHGLPALGPSRRNRRKRRPGLWVRRAVAISVLAVVVGTVGMGLGALVKHLLPPAKVNMGGAAEGDRLNILIIGVDPKALPADDNDKVVRRIADSLQILSLDYKGDRAYVLTIPRETRATLGDNGPGALGDALAFGGVPLLKQTVEELTDLQIHHYLWVDVDGARAIAKEMGDVQLFIPKAVKFTDAASQLSLDLKPGWQTLKPEQAVAYALHADPGEGLARIERQQMLLNMYQQRIHGRFASWWFPGAARRTLQEITTDLPKGDYEALADEWSQVDPRDITYGLLPGSVNTKGEWIFNPERWDVLLPRLKAVPGLKPVVDAKPTVELLYQDTAGDRVMGLAEQLTKQGFQVIHTGITEVPQDETLIYDRVRSDERSQTVLTALDAAVKGARVLVDPDMVSPYGAQYTVTLGKGYFR